jgi:alpha-mannosidase
MQTRIMTDTEIRTKNIAKKIQTIKEFIHIKIISLNNIRFTTGEIAGVEKPDFDDSDWELFSVGDFWGGRDVTCWFRIPLEISQELANEKLALIIQPGKRFVFKASEGGDYREYELMIYLDGEPLQSVDIRRNEIPIWDKVKPSGKYVLAIEAFSGLEDHQHKFEQADLVSISEDVKNFYYNLKIAFETMLAIGEQHPEFPVLFKLLEQSLLKINFLMKRESGFFKSINEANEYLVKNIYSKKPDKSDLPSVVSCGHAHLDIAWMWQVKHSKKKSGRTFANVLRIMEHYPDFRFLQSQPQLYKYVQENYPSLFAQMKARVENGQWEVTGGMWAEADCNIPNGESLVRQFLLGKRYFQREFSKDAKVVWLPDGFGFCYSLPQIIKKSGMKYFMTTKLSWCQFTKYPYDTFWWQGVDGTKILVHMITTPDPRGWSDYSVDLTPEKLKGCWDNYQQQKENLEVLLSFGWGDGGGGPTPEMLENAKRFDYMKPLPQHRQDSAENFFQDLESRVEKLPVWNDELYLQLHRGCYTSQAKIKKLNRQAEILYHNTELFSTLNYLTTGEYPQDELNAGWEKILLNQFHDILPGSSIPEVYLDCDKDYEQIFEIGSRFLGKSMENICLHSEPTNKKNKCVVYNSLSWDRSDLIKISIENFPINFDLSDKNGQTIPYQFVTDNKEILIDNFIISSMGYAAFEIVEMNEKPDFQSTLQISTKRLENQFFIIDLDNNGLLFSIFDKRFNREIIEKGKPGNVFQVFEDLPLTNDAWDIDIFYQDKFTKITELEKIEVTETGPIRGGLIINRKFMQSEIKQIIYIYDRIPRIDFCTEINWQQHQALLKVAFPMNIHTNKATYEIPYGSIERPTHWNTAWDWGRFEVPAQKWTDLSEGDYGVSLMNDCKYGYDIKDNVMRLTLIKSSIDPDPNADIGFHSFCYSLFPHGGTWQQGRTVQAAYELNYPLIPKLSSAGSQFSFVRTNCENVIIETVKKAEDGDGIIIRVYEACNQRGEVEFEFAYQLNNVMECNLLEEPETSLDFVGNKFRSEIKPYEIKTFRVEFKLKKYEKTNR